MDLRCIHIDVLAATHWGHPKVVHEATANLEEDFYAVDEEKHDDDEQQNRVAAVKDAVQSVFIAKEFRR